MNVECQPWQSPGAICVTPHPQPSGSIASKGPYDDARIAAHFNFGIESNSQRALRHARSLAGRPWAGFRWSISNMRLREAATGDHWILDFRVLKHSAPGRTL